LARAQTLRDAITGEGLDVGGRLSPLVLPLIGAEAVARIAQRRCFEHGVIVNSIEFPACRTGEARFRLQVTPRHDEQELRRAAAVIGEAVRWGRTQIDGPAATDQHPWA
jgi:7-keto-8-aminopelargonate synthetase-like enzyme